MMTIKQPLHSAYHAAPPLPAASLRTSSMVSKVLAAGSACTTMPADLVFMSSSFSDWRQHEDDGFATCRAVVKHAHERVALHVLCTREAEEHVRGSSWGLGGLTISGMDTSSLGRVAIHPLLQACQCWAARARSKIARGQAGACIGKGLQHMDGHGWRDLEQGVALASHRSFARGCQVATKAV